MSDIIIHADTGELIDARSVEQRLETVRHKMEVVQQAMERLMVNGIDYGPPYKSSTKKTLLKAGAEKLAMLFNLYADYEALTQVEDFANGVFHYRYRCVVRAIGSDVIIGAGIGSCNSKEDKYRYRYASPTCPKCRNDSIMRSKFGDKGWYCNPSNDGCGSNFPYDTSEIQNQAKGKVENTEPYTLVNTIDKIAQKRSLVAAMLIVTGASAFFTQDVEDFPDYSEKSSDNNAASLNDAKRHSLSSEKAQEAANQLSGKVSKKRRMEDNDQKPRNNKQSNAKQRDAAPVQPQATPNGAFGKTQTLWVNYYENKGNPDRRYSLFFDIDGVSGNATSFGFDAFEAAGLSKRFVPQPTKDNGERILLPEVPHIRYTTKTKGDNTYYNIVEVAFSNAHQDLVRLIDELGETLSEEWQQKGRPATAKSYSDGRTQDLFLLTAEELERVKAAMQSKIDELKADEKPAQPKSAPKQESKDDASEPAGIEVPLFTGTADGFKITSLNISSVNAFQGMKWVFGIEPANGAMFVLENNNIIVNADELPSVLYADIRGTKDMLSKAGIDTSQRGTWDDSPVFIFDVEQGKITSLEQVKAAQA